MSDLANGDAEAWLRQASSRLSGWRVAMIEDRARAALIGLFELAPPDDTGSRRPDGTSQLLSSDGIRRPSSP